MQNPFEPQNLLRLVVVLLLGVTSTVLFHRASGAAVSFQLSTNAFSPGESIPKTFTCDGLDVSPQLTWNDPPATTQSFALIMDDPDAPAGTWVHWVLYNLPTSARELAENIPNREQLSNGAYQGRNDFNKFGYGGPCPPPGKPHRYFFKLYALDTKLHLKPGAIKADVERAMQDHVRAQSQLIVLYSR
jgi:Raf kinase inhibitor-like YbhB/YbcL family protein